MEGEEPLRWAPPWRTCVPDTAQRERTHECFYYRASRRARSGAPLIRDRQKLRVVWRLSFVRSRVCSAAWAAKSRNDGRESGVRCCSCCTAPGTRL